MPVSCYNTALCNTGRRQPSYSLTREPEISYIKYCFTKTYWIYVRVCEDNSGFHCSPVETGGTEPACRRNDHVGPMDCIREQDNAISTRLRIYVKADITFQSSCAFKQSCCFYCSLSLSLFGPSFCASGAVSWFPHAPLIYMYVHARSNPLLG
jgi:hypothetical protein